MHAIKKYNQKITDQNSLPRAGRGKRVSPGFTIIELGIVLLIIGALLAAIMVGRDVVRNAQIKRFHQQFVMKWVSIASSYYDKTGHYFGDGLGNGGGEDLLAGGIVTPNGRMDWRVFQPDFKAIEALQRVGIDPCQLIKSPIDNVENSTTGVNGSECNGRAVSQTVVTGEYAGAQVVSVDFMWIPTVHRPDEHGGVQGNYMVLYNVPLDVGIALDTAIDGAAGGDRGSVLLTTETVCDNSLGETINSTITIVDWSYKNDPDSQQSIKGACNRVNMLIKLDF